MKSVSAVRSQRTETRARAPETVLVTINSRQGLAAQSLYTWEVAALEDEAEGAGFGSERRIQIRVSYEQALGGAFRMGGSSDEAVALSPAENYYDGHRLIIDDWVTCIRRGGRLIVTGSDGCGDFAVVPAASRSLQEDGQPVEVASLAVAQENAL